MWLYGMHMCLQGITTSVLLGRSINYANTIKLYGVFGSLVTCVFKRCAATYRLWPHQGSVVYARANFGAEDVGLEKALHIFAHDGEKPVPSARKCVKHHGLLGSLSVFWAMILHTFGVQVASGPRGICTSLK